MADGDSNRLSLFSSSIQGSGHHRPRKESKPISSIFNPYSWHFDNVCIPISIILGFVVGICAPGNSDLSPNYRPISSVIGWVYFFCWTLSFYPQIYQNWKRRTSVGLASDKILMDLVGYSCLSTYTVGLYGVPYIRQLYADRNHGNMPQVQINDVCFAVHALLMTFVQIAQMYSYDGRKQMPTLLARAGIVIVVILILVYLAVVLALGNNSVSIFSILDWFYFISFVKIGITCLKYVPQVLLNYKRKCTVGWNITACIMDITGSSLSALQLILDANNAHDWSAITGNFVKVALGFVSMIFDIIFFIQHYVLYSLSAEFHHLPDFGSESLLLPGEINSKDDDDEDEYQYVV